MAGGKRRPHACWLPPARHWRRRSLEGPAGGVLPSEGDTLTVIMARRSGARATLENRWRLLPVEPSEDGTFAYIFVYHMPLDLQTGHT